jgi:chromosomal replication initiation ATPase DnaA
MSQYALPINLPPVFSEDNFFISESNREAHRWITSWPDWPGHALLLTGGPGSGKTHLGHIWAGRSQAVIVDAAAPEPADHLFVDNIERIGNERSLLHLINYSRENNYWLLLASALPAVQLPFRLPDLTSRLKALPVAAIAPPDDALLAGALRKQFSDRQLKVEEEVIAYITARIERSLASVKATVEKLDAEALAQRRSLTVPFVREALSYSLF